ncbi:MAG: glycoside hydrolase family 36 protein [Chloroflexota bacterium]|nr:glycoside hydrolase family 36 protein [Chloroflexota bacterium]
MTQLLQGPSFNVCLDRGSGVLRLESPGRSLRGELGMVVGQHDHAVQLATAELTPFSIERYLVTDAHGSAEELQIRYQEADGLLLSLHIRVYAARPYLLLRVGVLNKGPAAVKLRRFFLRTSPRGVQLAGEPSGFYSTGWQSWSPAGFLARDAHDYTTPLLLRPLAGPMLHNANTPWSGKRGRFWSESVGVVVTPREALVAGAVSLAEQFVQLYADLRPGNLALLLQAQLDDVPLGVGESRQSEWFYLEWVPFPAASESSTCIAPAWVDPLAQYAYAVARQMHVPPPRLAPTGWSSRYIFGEQVAETDLMANLASAALLADEIPLQVIQLDQGFEPIWGDWTERNARFPHPLAWLADRIQGSGFRPGLWLGPLTVHPKSQLAQEHPAWLLRDKRGRPVSAGWIAGRFRAQALDPTHPEVEQYLHDLISTAVEEWGYDYLKLDFLYAGALPGERHNPHLTRAQAYRHALRIMREAAGENTYLVGCGAPLGASVGLVDAMRIGPDTAPYWAPRVPLLRNLFQSDASLPSLRNNLRNVATRAWMHNRWWQNDPDNLMVRADQTALTQAEIISQLTLQGLTGGSFVLSDDLPALSPERQELAAALLPALVEGMDPLDLFSREMPVEVVAPLVQPWENWQLVGLFNWSAESLERPLPCTLPNFDLAEDYHIVDFWQHRYLRLKHGDPLPRYSLAPHGAVLLGVRPVKTAPQLVATTFHISQGGELTEWAVEGTTVTLALRLGRRAAGEVWLSLPAAPCRVALNAEPLGAEAVRAVARGIWAIQFRVEGEAALKIYYGD